MLSKYEDNTPRLTQDFSYTKQCISSYSLPSTASQFYAGPTEVPAVIYTPVPQELQM